MKLFRKIITFLTVLFIPLIAGAQSTNSVDTASGGDLKSASQQQAEAVKQVSSPSFALMDTVVGLAGSLGNGPKAKGLQFKNPMFSPVFSFSAISDDSPGGFDGEQYSGSLGLDADIYDGFITGVIYQHTYRESRNNLGTSERLDSNGVSLYGAKRFFDVLNVGLAYNYANSEHRLTRAVTANLDRDSNGFSMFAGASNRKGKWSWSTTTSFGYVNDDYEKQNTLETGRFGWGGSLAYDMTKKFTLGAAFGYYNFIFQDAFPNSTIRDNDYWTLGPRFQYFPNDRVTVNLDLESQQGYVDFSAYTLRLGVDIAF